MSLIPLGSIIAVSGVGGHAFGSFKATDQDYMWLRDGLPHDITSAHVFTYGYLSPVPGSKSFQSLQDLGRSFESALVGLVDGNKKVC